jgi:hypothetical protein
MTVASCSSSEYEYSHSRPSASASSRSPTLAPDDDGRIPVHSSSSSLSATMPVIQRIVFATM